MPFKDKDYAFNFDVDTKVNTFSFKIHNNLKEVPLDDKISICTIHKILENESIIEGKFLTGIVLFIRPEKFYPISLSSQAEIKSKHLFVQKIYKDKNDIFKDINNGSLNTLNGNGINSLKINGRLESINVSDRLYLAGDKLSAFVTKDSNIRITGLADLILINDKVMNIRTISVINNMLTPFSSSINEVVKWIIGLITMAPSIK
ncbi:hypothetical protein [Pantoea sp. SS70]|uniref:hypothetical protein n=1 Tax=Pantoea sp. SS70 TaxID=3024247 RepID=UPI002452FA31|nr:hypothetical protein [Pantoea sp. SS70]WGK60073.1 hypothetical protein PO881_23295 [Pantoea sp. SS70]